MSVFVIVSQRNLFKSCTNNYIYINTNSRFQRKVSMGRETRVIFSESQKRAFAKNSPHTRTWSENKKAISPFITLSRFYLHVRPRSPPPPFHLFTFIYFFFFKVFRQLVFMKSWIFTRNLSELIWELILTEESRPLSFNVSYLSLNPRWQMWIQVFK